MKHIKSTLQALCLLLTALLFSTPLAAQSRGGGWEEYPHVDIEVDAGQTVVETGTQFVFSYPVQLENAPSWVSFDEGASDSRGIICLEVEENPSTSPREATFLVKHYYETPLMVVVHIVQAGR